MRRRRKNKKQVKLVVVISICLLLIMTVGYAAFSTNLTLSAKGNIKQITRVEDLKKSVVVAGDGLYNDNYEDGRYIYKGASPKNYIKFSDSLWRIVAIEKDNVFKIKKQLSIGIFAYDEAGLRDSSSNGAGGTYCSNFSEGCPVWAKSDNFVNGNVSGTVLLDASLNTYLNTTYYDSLTEEKKYIQPYDFRIGVVSNFDLDNLIKYEKSLLWNGKIAMLNMSDFFRATNNSGCDVKNNGYWKDNNTLHDYYLCSHNNYLYINNNTRFLNPYNNSVSGMGQQGSLGSILAPSSPGNYVYPVLYLKSDIKLTGSGTESDPYIIK